MQAWWPGPRNIKCPHLKRATLGAELEGWRCGAPGRLRADLKEGQVLCSYALKLTGAESGKCVLFACFLFLVSCFLPGVPVCLLVEAAFLIQFFWVPGLAESSSSSSSSTTAFASTQQNATMCWCYKDSVAVVPPTIVVPRHLQRRKHMWVNWLHACKPRDGVLDFWPVHVSSHHDIRVLVLWTLLLLGTPYSISLRTCTHFRTA